MSRLKAKIISVGNFKETIIQAESNLNEIVRLGTLDEDALTETQWALLDSKESIFKDVAAIFLGSLSEDQRKALAIVLASDDGALLETVYESTHGKIRRYD